MVEKKGLKKGSWAFATKLTKTRPKSIFFILAPPEVFSGTNLNI
jgi:hypothetical protein